jgi:hypothetical protein
MGKAAKIGHNRRVKVVQVFLDDMVETGDLEIASFTRDGKPVYRATQMSTRPSMTEAEVPGHDSLRGEVLARLTEAEFQKLLADLKRRLRKMRDLPN